MRALSPRQIDQRLGKLEAKTKAADDANAFRQVIFLSGDDPEGDYPEGTVVIRFVEPGHPGTPSADNGEYRLPHNGREARPGGEA
jgi:hypothetical protein